MNNLGNNPRSSVANPKILLQDLESAVVAAVPESTAEHVKWHGCGRDPFFPREGKSRLGIDEAPNQPCGCGPVHTGPRSRYPDPVLIIQRLDLPRFWRRRRHACFVGPSKQLPDTLL